MMAADRADVDRFRSPARPKDHAFLRHSRARRHRASAIAARSAAESARSLSAGKLPQLRSLGFRGPPTSPSRAATSPVLRRS